MPTTLLLPPPPRTDAEFARIVDELTRRGLLAGGFSTAAVLGLGACSVGQPASHAGADAGRWTFTDDLGHKLSLSARPARLVSLIDDITALLWSQGLHSIVGSAVFPPDRGQLESSGVPVGQLAKLSTGQYSGYSAERIAALKPDLIIDGIFDGKPNATSTDPVIGKIAPVLALSTTGNSLDDVFRHAQRLVSSLGVAPSASARARDAYDGAASRLKKTLAGKPGLRVAFCQAYGPNLLVSNPAGFPLFGTLQDLGMGFMPVHATPGGSQPVSWELVPGLPVDLLFIIGGDGPITNAGWKAMPAVKAGQVVDTRPWGDGAGVYGYGYTYLATVLDHMASAVMTAEPGIGPRQ